MAPAELVFVLGLVQKGVAAEDAAVPVYGDLVVEAHRHRRVLGVHQHHRVALGLTGLEGLGQGEELGGQGLLLRLRPDLAQGEVDLHPTKSQ